jgi:hypothetical protein
VSVLVPGEVPRGYLEGGPSCGDSTVRIVSVLVMKGLFFLQGILGLP